MRKLCFLLSGFWEGSENTKVFGSNPATRRNLQGGSQSVVAPRVACHCMWVHTPTTATLCETKRKTTTVVRPQAIEASFVKCHHGDYNVCSKKEPTKQEKRAFLFNRVCGKRTASRARGAPTQNNTVLPWKQGNTLALEPCPKPRTEIDVPERRSRLSPDISGRLSGLTRAVLSIFTETSRLLLNLDNGLENH